MGIQHRLANLDLTNLEEVASFLKRGVFAMSLLEHVARQKIPTLRFVDEIEVYLAYPLKLKEVLQLPINVNEMLFFHCSALTEKDLIEAKDFVLSHLDNQEIVNDFLISQHAWKEALKKKYPQAVAKILTLHDYLWEDAIEAETKIKKSWIDLTNQALNPNSLKRSTSDEDRQETSSKKAKR
jgi:hypothetical protein